MDLERNLGTSKSRLHVWNGGCSVLVRCPFTAIQRSSRRRPEMSLLLLDKFTVNVPAWSPVETISQEDSINLNWNLTIELRGGLMLCYTKLRSLTMSEDQRKLHFFSEEG